MPSKIAFLFIIASLLFAGCERRKQISDRKVENDSLRKALESPLMDITMVRHMEGLIDSIEINLNEGGNIQEKSPAKSLSGRLQDINFYVKESENKIARIERELQYSKNAHEGYSLIVKAFEGETGIRLKEVDSLRSTIILSSEENKTLDDLVRFQNDSLESMKQELSFLQTKLQGLATNVRIAEAEAVYARAKTVEEVARRSKGVPYDVSNAYKEALELYKKAFSLGKAEAKHDIEKLEKLLSPHLNSFSAAISESDR